MSFTSLPNPGQSLGQTRDAIKDNFDVLRSTIAVDHYDVNAVSNIGMHRIIEMPEQTTFLTTPANQGNAFCRDYNGRTEMMFQPESTLNTGDQFCLSGMPIRAGCLFDATGADGVKTIFGRSFNIVSVTKSTFGAGIRDYAVVFTSTFPISAASSNYLVLSFSDGGTDIVLTALSKATTGFTLRSSFTANATKIQFIVLGG